MENRKYALAFAAFVCTLLISGNVAAGGFIEDRPWLVERSAWSETTGPGGGLRGWWAVGNSRVFGIVGTGNPITTIHQITGPHIMLAGLMNNGSAFNPSTMDLSFGDKPVQFTKQTLSKVRGTNIVVMDLVGDGIEMSVFNYAPFGMNALLRTVVIKNTGKAPLADVVLRSNLYRTVVKDGQLYNSFKGGTGGSAMGQTRQMFAGFLEQAEVTGPEEKPGTGALTVKIGTVPAGGEVVRTKYLVFSMKEIGDEAKTLALVKNEGTKLLKKTYDDWQSWFSTKTRLECPDQRLIDLLDDNKMLVKIQTAEPQYAAGPMEFFAGVWVRDSNGPFLYYLRMGDLEAAKGMLEFYYRASAYNKRIVNNMPMDIDISKPLEPRFDWTAVYTDPVETPSWLIMQHMWYYRYTGDIGPIRGHWDYLKRCLYGQIVNHKAEPFYTIDYASKVTAPNKMYRFPHHGDETWIYPGFEILNSRDFPEPNDHPHWDSYSTDSTWEFVVSAEIMAEFARLLGRANEAKGMEDIARDGRAAIERDYWMPEKGLYAPAMNMRSLDMHQPPFAMVNFNALWIDYLDPEDPKAISNVVETMKYTMNPNYVTDVTETLRVYVGMQPGMFLYNLAAIDHPFAEPALKAMMEVASPSGEYTEKHVTDPNSYRSGFRGHRIRPWEGGINMDAAYYYLTGLKPDMGNNRIALCPRLPFEWKEMSVTGQKLGNGQLDLNVADNDGKRSYTIKWTGTKPITADFKVSLPQSKIASVKVGGKAVPFAPKSRWNTTTAQIEVVLPAAQTTVVAVEYAKETVKPLKFSREKYEYIVPKDVPPYQMVLWENERRRGNVGDLRTFDYLEKSSVNYRLICAYNPCSPVWLRPFLLRKDGRINTPLFMMGQHSVTSSLKYGKFWGNPELVKLFTEYMRAGGTIIAINTGETTSEHFGKLLGDSEYLVVPMSSTPIIPAVGVGEEVCDKLALFDGEKKTTTTKMLSYNKMIVLARPESEQSGATIVAKKFGKGIFVRIIGNFTYEQMGAMGQKLAEPATLSAIKKLITGAKPESVAGVFEDFSKNNSYSDDFSSYKAGSVGLPVWLTLSGSWKMQGGELHQLLTGGYDHISTANAKIKGDYVVECRMKLVKNIFEGGFVFNLPSRFKKGSGQMVRFCGHPAIWRGPFSPGGGFGFEPPIKTGLTASDEEWHTFKLSVYNSKGTYDIAVDGKTVAQGLKLTNKAPESGCYIGLVACRGHVAFDDLKVTPIK